MSSVDEILKPVHEVSEEVAGRIKDHFIHLTELFGQIELKVLLVKVTKYYTTIAVVLDTEIFDYMIHSTGRISENSIGIAYVKELLRKNDEVMSNEN
ncbi:hypothetical protein [Halalkalibacter sp. APA_J-10(15)]|uniref:hypothetical protein n=1 Tax=Halalkalibacter sp. APA_J-10(15) TaxID=2933805 RepID=UPI001FF69A86|nr:hypothetical protein [Halalkalibacter sp. APA_J-10(15)]MCK0471429.1 hypothetical protein [Halalkalibacter sp. APA_J-10(15)]